MIIIINDDSAYLSWVNHHRNGFVLETRRKPTRRNTMLHRATCSEIKSPKTKRTHWTTGRKVKACSIHIEELQKWAHEETGCEATLCELCVPDHQFTSEELAQRAGNENHDHVTKLGREILSYVVEIAIINLDNETSYKVTVGEVAKMLSKTPGQLTAALIRLIEDGFLTMAGTIAPGQSVPSTRIVYPTSKAFRSEPAFADISQAELDSEIDKLKSELDENG